MLHIHVQRYTTKIRIREIYLGNPEKHEIGSGTKLLFTFLSLKVFRYEEGETQFLSMLTFPSEPHHVRHPWRKLLVWPWWAPKIDFLRLSPNLNYCFFFKSPKTSALPGITSFTSPVLFTIWGFYCDISDKMTKRWKHMNVTDWLVDRCQPVQGYFISWG